MKHILAVGLIALLIFGLPPAAQAQSADPVVVGGSVSISAELRSQLESYLADSPPSVTAYYAPTYVQSMGQYTLISLAALNIQAPDDPWYIETSDEHDTNVLWTGTVRINEDGSGSLFSTPMDIARNLPKLAMPILPGAGGGAYVRLPFQPSRAMQYGVRGIHGAGDYGTSGMRAVDLVGGTSLGNNVAGPTVYASTAGTVDYVCTDDFETVVRTYNAATDDYFLYAHMYDNASLELDHVFAAGAIIGTLRPGTYTDDCGWTEQDDNIYHIHWMFEPASGAFRVGAYTILQSDGKFHSGSNVYGTGSWISNTGTPPTGDDDPQPGGYLPSFWDPIVSGLVNAAGGFAEQLPGATTVTILHTATNTIILFFRLSWILVRGNLNLNFVSTVLVATITMRLLLGVPWIVAFILRVVRVIKQTISPLG